MGENKILLKVVAILLLPLLMCESVWSMPAAELFAAREPSSRIQPSVFTALEDRILAADIHWKNPPQVPFENGERVESFSGSAPYRVFIIQDAHALPDAQKSAAKILDFWISKLGLSFVGLEGASGDLPHSKLSSFPNRTARRMLAETLLEEAVIGGPEYLQMTRYPALKLRGVEDGLLYESNRAAFLNVVSQREAAVKILNSMRAQADEEALKKLPVDYLRFNKLARQAHERGDWQDYLVRLQEIQLKQRLSGHYPAFDFWRKAHELSEKVSPDQMRSEAKLIAKKGKLGRLIAEAASQLMSGEEPEKNIQIEIALWKQNPEWLKKFPSVTSALKAAFLMRRIGTTLFDEVAALEKELTLKMCPEREQKELARRIEDLNVAFSMARLSLTAADYEEWLTRRAAFDAETLASANGITLNKEEKKQLAETLSAAENFYRIAMRRDEALAQNFIREIQKENQKIGALVIGGFHTAGLLRLFREKGVSYEVVRPQVKNIETAKYQSLYEKRMSTQTSKLEWARQGEIESLERVSHAQLQLQTPRRTDVEFVNGLYALLTGMSGAMTAHPAELSDLLSASAGVLSVRDARDLKNLGQVIHASSGLWISPDGQTVASWFQGTESQPSLMVASGPGAKTMTGTGAVAMETAGRRVWIRRGGSSPMPALSAWKAASPARSEIRTDDELVILPWQSSLSDLGDYENLKRALEIRLEAFAESLQFSGSNEAQKLSSGGMVLTFKYDRGRAQITSIETNWSDRSAAARALMLIYWEEYLSGVSSDSKQQVKTVATVDRVVRRFLERAQNQNLLEEFIANQPAPAEMVFWQHALFSSAEILKQTGSFEAVSRNIPVLFEDYNKKRQKKIEVPSSPEEWESWKTRLRDVARVMSGRMVVELQGQSQNQGSVLFQDQVPEFLLRHALILLRSEKGFNAGLAENLQGASRVWMDELVALTKKGEVQSQPEDVRSQLSVPVAAAEPVIVSRQETKPDVLVQPDLARVNWFEGLPGKDQPLDGFDFDQLAEFIRIFESRQSEHPEEFLADNRILLPYYEALVAALEKKTPVSLDAAKADTDKHSSEDESVETPVPNTAEKKKRISLFHSLFDLSLFAIAAGALQIFGISFFALPVLSLPAFLTAYGLILAYRAGWLGGVLLNEWGHQFAALSAGKWRTFFTFSNWLGNLSLGDLFLLAVPGTALPSGYVVLDSKETGAISFVRWAGWLVGLVGFFYVASQVVMLALPPYFILFVLGGGLWAQSVGTVSDLINPPQDETCAACGNLGGMAVNQGPETAQFMQTMFQGMGDVLQVRGGQAGGSVLLRQNAQGQIIPYLNRSVNTKHGVLRKKMHAGAAQSLKKGTTPPVYFDFRHVRFGTSSAPSEIETHPHQWLPNREVTRWTQTPAGLWQKATVVLGNFISHNGDFDDYRLSGKMRSNGQVGQWLAQILGYSNPALGDSPKAAGMMDFLITQGMWDASFRYAYHTVTQNAFDEALAGRAPSRVQIQSAARIFEAAFEIWKNQKEGTRESLIKLIQDRTGGTYSQELIQTAVNAFFDQDSYRAVQIFTANAEGTFGFLAGSSIYPNKIVMYGDSQPLSVGFDPAKKFLVWTSEPTVLKVPLPDQSRIPYRLDLLQDIGEVFEITLPSSGIPQLKVYDKNKRRELSAEEMQKSFRLIDMLKSPYVSPLPALDYQNQDLVALDLKDMAGALDRLREDWLKADSTNRRTANALVQILVEKYIGKMIKDHSGLVLSGAASQYATKQASQLAQDFLSREISEKDLMTRVHDVSDVASQIFEKMKRNPKTKMLMNNGESAIEDPVDILITGMANNLWAAEPFAARLSEMFPRLRIATTSSNKILRALKSTGLQTPIKKITVRENSRLITISRNTIVIVADGDMGQDFAPLNAAIALRKLIGDRLFMITPEYDTKLGALVQNFHKDAPFGNRIFRTFAAKDTAWRPAEATTLSQQAVDQTFTEILLRLGQDMRDLFSMNDPFRMPMSKADFDQLRLHNREHTHVKISDITGYNIDGTERQATANRQILKPFTRWSRHISENIWTWYAVKFFVLLTVTFSFPPSAWIGLLPWAESLGMPLLLLGVHAVDAVIYAGSAYIFKFLLRLVQGRETMHRQGARSITIADVPKVNQIIKQYVTKLTAQASFLSDFFVDSSNPADHGPYKDPHRVRRGGLIVLGLTEGVLVGLGHAFKSAKLYGSQAQGIQSLPFQSFWDFAGGIPVLGRLVRAFGFKLIPPEILTVGQHPRLEPNAASENIYLGERVQEVKASSERLVRQLSQIKPLYGKSREIQGVVEGRIESLNEFATGDFNKDVASLSDLLMTDLKLPENFRDDMEIAVEGYMRQHVFLTGFIEERFFQNQRIAAMQVGFHHMVSRYSYSANKMLFRLKQMLGIGHRHWETQSHLRVATTASPESGADVTAVAQRMAESGHALPKPEIEGAPDALPFEMVRARVVSQAEEDTASVEAARLAAEEQKQKKQMQAQSLKARERLARVQKEVVDFELSQLQALAEIARGESDALKKIVFQAVFHRYARTRNWIGMNGVSADLSSQFKNRLEQLRRHAEVGDEFERQSINQKLPQIGFDALRKKNFGNPKGLAEDVVKQVFANRSEQRTGADSAMVAGLKAQDAMRSGMEADRLRSEMRFLFSRSNQELHEASAAIWGNQVSDAGVVVLERPYDPKWVRQFVAKLPTGARVVMRAPDETSVDRAAYSRDLAAEIRRGIFSFQFSTASSENWLQKYFGDEFAPENVIQVESPENPSAADDEMLLLSAPMAAGHVLVLGQSKKLNLPGMRWIQISVWISQLYDAVMATQTSA